MTEKEYQLLVKISDTMQSLVEVVSDQNEEIATLKRRITKLEKHKQPVALTEPPER